MDINKLKVGDKVYVEISDDQDGTVFFRGKVTVFSVEPDKDKVFFVETDLVANSSEIKRLLVRPHVIPY